jgi:hypothetical protein
MKLPPWLRRERLDPSQPHAFRLANDGYRVIPASLPGSRGSSGAHMLAVQRRDEASARCDVPGCERRRNDPIHQLDD